MNAVSQRGDTALSCACGNGHTNVAEVLLKAGSNLVRKLSSHDFKARAVLSQE